MQKVKITPCCLEHKNKYIIFKYPSFPCSNLFQMIEILFMSSQLLKINNKYLQKAKRVCFPFLPPVIIIQKISFQPHSQVSKTQVIFSGLQVYLSGLQKPQNVNINCKIKLFHNITIFFDLQILIDNISRLIYNA